MVSSPGLRPFGKPTYPGVVARSPNPRLGFGVAVFSRRISPLATATLARMPMFVAFVPSAVNVPTMLPAKRPLASSTGVAALNSFLRGNGMSAVLTAGVAPRST